VIQDRVDPEVVRASLERVLAREGIPALPREPSWIERWLSELMTSLGGAAEGLDLARLLLIVLGVMAVALVVGLVLPRVRSRASSSSADQDPTAQQRRARARELRLQARQAEEGGDLALALRLGLFALVVALSEEGTLDFRPAWTDRELLARGAPPLRVRERLEALLDAFEPKTFGGVSTEPGDLRALEALAGELTSEDAA
jgi:Domain of unknown function (DUF4129)